MMSPLHFPKQSWSCAAISTYQAAFGSPSLSNPRNSVADLCGFCGGEFSNQPPNWEERIDHLTSIHKFGECNAAKKFYRIGHFRRHLKHTHASKIGRWTSSLEIQSYQHEEAPSAPETEHLRSDTKPTTNEIVAKSPSLDEAPLRKLPEINTGETTLSSVDLNASLIPSPTLSKRGFSSLPLSPALDVQTDHERQPYQREGRNPYRYEGDVGNFENNVSQASALTAPLNSFANAATATSGPSDGTTFANSTISDTEQEAEYVSETPDSPSMHLLAGTRRSSSTKKETDSDTWSNVAVHGIPNSFEFIPTEGPDKNSALHAVRSSWDVSGCSYGKWFPMREEWESFCPPKYDDLFEYESTPDSAFQDLACPPEPDLLKIPACFYCQQLQIGCIGAASPCQHCLEKSLTCFRTEDHISLAPMETPWKIPSHFTSHEGTSTYGEGMGSAATAEAPTDSGYASLTRDNLRASAFEGGGIGLTKTQPSHEDAKTIYSDGVSVETTQRDSFVDRLAELLKEDLKDVCTSNMPINGLCGDIKDCLADFAMRLGQESSLSKLRRAMVFIHKYRSMVESSFRNLLQLNVHDENEENDENREATDNMPLGELMSRWFDDQTTEPTAASTILEDPIVTDHEILLNEPSLHDDPNELDIYSKLLSTSESYKWLLARLRNKVLLSYDNSESCQFIRESVLKLIPKEAIIKVGVVSRAVEAVFSVNWPLWHFLETQLEPDSDSDSFTLGSIVTLTGRPPDIQIMTCNEYLRQTWPTTGIYLLKAVEEALKNASLAFEILRPDGASLTVTFVELTCVVSICGSRDMVAELAEQLAWLSAALRSPPSGKDLTTCSPLLHGQGETVASQGLPQPLDKLHPHADVFLHRDSQVDGSNTRPGKSDEANDAVHIFKITFEFARVDFQSYEGMCWEQILPQCSIVKGFPIRRRTQSSRGMETPLNIMAALVGTNRVNQYRDTIFIRGFSAIYAPTQVSEDCITWHLTCDKNGGHLSYRDIPKYIENFDLEALEDRRHIVGWCTNITNSIGTNDTSGLVLESQLPTAKPGCALDKFWLTFPKEIVIGPTFTLLRCQKSIHLASATFFAKFKHLKDHFTLFWDTGDDRGWLTNCLAAFLQLVRDIFASYESPTKAELMSFWRRLRLVAKSVSTDQSREMTTDHAPWPPVASGLDPHNLEEKSSIADVALQIGTRVCDQLYDGLDKLITIQEQIERDMTSTSRSLRLLEGWSFVDLTSQHGSKRPRVMSLPTIAFTWAKFLRSLSTVTIFGERFGELLSPHRQCSGIPLSLEPQPRVQRQCQQLQVDKFLVAVAMRDLRVKMRRSKYCPGALTLGDATILFNYASAFTNCACRYDNQDNRPDYHRYICMPWPVTHRKVLPATTSVIEGDIFVSPEKFAESYIDGAIVLGHDDGAGYFLDEHGKSVKGNPPDAYVEQEEAFNDSGLGTNPSRISQASPTSRIISRSTDELSPQDSAMLLKDRSQSYKDSVVYGGAPVYGNIINVTNNNNMLAASQTSYLDMSSMPDPYDDQFLPGVIDRTSTAINQNRLKRTWSESQHCDISDGSDQTPPHDSKRSNTTTRATLLAPVQQTQHSRRVAQPQPVLAYAAMDRVKIMNQAASSSSVEVINRIKRCCRCFTAMNVDKPAAYCEECVHEFCGRCGILMYDPIHGYR